MNDDTTPIPNDTPVYRRPEIQTIGSVADLTLGGNGKGLDDTTGKKGS